MTVCKFFLEGRCNFGSTCRNEHPGDAQQRNNRFGATDSNNPLRGRIGFPSSSDYPPNRIYDERSVRGDLSKDRPEYKYSCYGPAKEEPNLIEGTDYSAEELRLQYYNIMSTNGVDTAYRAGVKDLDERMQGRIDTILRDVRSTLNQFESKRQQLAQQQASSGFAFGQPSQPQHQPVPQQQQAAYGTPSVLGAPATPSPFSSSINQPNQPNQPSTPSLLGSSYNQPTAPTPSLFGANPSGFGASNYSGTSYPVAQTQQSPGSIFGGYQHPQPDPQQQQQQYLFQMQQQELLAQQQQQQQQQMLMLQQQQMQQPPQPGNTQGTINNPQMQAFESSQFELYKIPEIPPPSDYRR